MKPIYIMKRRRRLPAWAVLPSLALGLLGPGIGCKSASEPPNGRRLTLLTFNIGNPDDTDPDYPLRLSYQAYEDFVGEQIRSLDADIVLLQEVLPPQTCAAFTESDPQRTCYDAANRPPAAQRLLGDGYTVVCDAREHVECIGIKTSWASVDGVLPGAFVLDGADTPPLPLASCIYAGGGCDNDHCDAESSISAITVQVATDPTWTLRVVHAHPNAAGTGSGGFYLGDRCRALQLEQIFAGLAGVSATPLVATGPTLVAGDFNMDPDLLAGADERAVYQAHVGPGRRFADLGPRDPDGDTYPTRRGGFGVAIDRIVADATGNCTVYGHEDSFGPDPGTDPLDETFDWAALPGGRAFPGRIDHFAIYCELTF